MSKLTFIQLAIFSTLLCLQCSAGAVTYYEQTVSGSCANILSTKLVQTQTNDYVLATLSTLATDNSFQLSISFLSQSNQTPIIVNSDAATFAWDIRPTYNDTNKLSVDVFFGSSSNSSWYIYRYYSDGTSQMLYEDTSDSFTPNSFLVYQPEDGDFGSYVVANSKRELYMSANGTFNKIGDFVSIDYANFPVGKVGQNAPLFFIGVSPMDPRSAIWVVDPSSAAGAVPQRIDSSEGILSIGIISLDEQGTVVVHETLNGFTKIYKWKMSDPDNTFTQFQIQGTFILLPFMNSPKGRFLVYNSDPLPVFGKVKLTQWVNWDGNDPMESSDFVVADYPAISGLASMTSTASYYYETQSLSVVIAYPIGEKVRITELTFSGDRKSPQNIAISGFQVPQGMKSSNRRLLSSALGFQFKASNYAEGSMTLAFICFVIVLISLAIVLGILANKSLSKSQKWSYSRLEDESEQPESLSELPLLSEVVVSN